MVTGGINFPFDWEKALLSSWFSASNVLLTALFCRVLATIFLINRCYRWRYSSFSASSISSIELRLPCNLIFLACFFATATIKRPAYPTSVEQKNTLLELVLFITTIFWANLRSLLTARILHLLCEVVIPNESLSLFFRSFLISFFTHISNNLAVWSQSPENCSPLIALHSGPSSFASSTSAASSVTRRI